MARITRWDCERIVPNRFELVLLAAARARELARGAEPVVEAGRDAVTVAALREIAAGRAALDRLRASWLRRLEIPPAVETTAALSAGGRACAEAGPDAGSPQEAKPAAAQAAAAPAAPS